MVHNTSKPVNSALRGLVVHEGTIVMIEGRFMHKLETSELCAQDLYYIF